VEKKNVCAVVLVAAFLVAAGLVWCLSVRPKTVRVPIPGAGLTQVKYRGHTFGLGYDGSICVVPSGNLSLAYGSPSCMYSIGDMVVYFDGSVYIVFTWVKTVSTTLAVPPAVSQGYAVVRVEHFKAMPRVPWSIV